MSLRGITHKGAADPQRALFLGQPSPHLMEKLTSPTGGHAMSHRLDRKRGSLLLSVDTQTPRVDHTAIATPRPNSVVVRKDTYRRVADGCDR